jgi:hypothetical protein
MLRTFPIASKTARAPEQFYRDLLVSRPGEWIDFNSQTLGYKSPRSSMLKADIAALRERTRADCS